MPGQTTGRPLQVLNVDAVIRATPIKYIEMGGKRHLVSEISTDVGLQLTQLIDEVQKAADTKDFAALIEANVRLLILLVPTLVEFEAMLRGLDVELLKTLVEYVMSAPEDAKRLVRENDKAIEELESAMGESTRAT